jgi:two-component system NtrC family sensor kinase
MRYRCGLTRLFRRLEGSMAVSWSGSQPRMVAVGNTLLAHMGAVAVLLLLTGWGLQFHFERPPVPLVWTASAVALAAAFRLGSSTAITVALAIGVVHLARGVDPLAAALLAVSTGLAGWLGAYLLRRWQFSPEFGRVHDLGVLLVAGCGVGAAIGALAASVVMMKGDATVAEAFGLCWVAETMGMLLVVPFLMSARLPSTRVDPETLGWLVGVPVVVYGIYAGGLPEMTALPASYAVFPLIMAVALRRSVPVVALVLLLVAFIAINCTAMGKGPFVQADMRPNMLALHAHLAMLVLTGLLLAAIRSERSAAESRAREHLRMLARAGRISALSTMAAGIAHDFNNIMMVVVLYAQMLLRTAQLTPKEKEQLDTIGQQARHATNLIEQILDFSRRSVIERRHLELLPFLKEFLRLLERTLPENVQIEFSREEGQHVVNADATRLQQILMNLAVNARDAMPDGGRCAFPCPP